MGTYKTYNIGGKTKKVYVPSSKSSTNTLTRKKGSTQYTPKSSSGGSDKATPVIAPQKTEVGVASSEQGLEVFQDAKRRAAERFSFPVSGPEAGLTPEQQQSELEAQKKRFGPDYTAGEPGSANTPKGDTQTAEPQATATYINPETDQTQTIKGSAAEVQSQGANLESQGYQLAESDQTVVTEKTPQETALEEAVAEYQRQVETITEQLDASLISDKELRDQRNAITKIWNARIKQVEDINKRNNASLDTQLMRQGSRYVVGTTQGIISEAERQGVVQIGELEAQKQSAILEAEAAARDYNYDVYVKLMDEANSLQDAKVAELANLREAQQAQEAALAEERKRVEQEAKIVEAFQAGNTSVMDIAAYTNGEVPFDTINSIVADINEQKEMDAKVRKILAEADSEERGDLQFVTGTSYQQSGFFNKKTGVFTSVGGSVSTKTTGTTYVDPTTGKQITIPGEATEEEKIIIEDIIRQLPVRLKDNVAERPILVEGILRDLRRGLGFQEIADKMAGFVLTESADKEFGYGILAYTGGTDVPLSDISRQVNYGNYVQAMTTVENAQLDNVDMLLAKTDNARGFATQARKVSSLIDKVPTNKLGAFDKQTFKFRRVGNLSTEEDLKVQQLETAMQALSGQFRLIYSGQQVTDQEFNRLSELQVDIYDQPDIAKTKADELATFVTDMNNEARSQRGLPTITTEQLLDNNQRVQVYRDIAAQKNQNTYTDMSNEDLLYGAIETISPGSVNYSSVDANGYPI